MILDRFMVVVYRVSGPFFIIFRCAWDEFRGNNMSAGNGEGERVSLHPADPGGVAARDVVRAVVQSQASYEMAYFARLTRFGDSWALWRLRRTRGRDEALGFGSGETATLITAVLWIVLNETAREFGLAAGDGMFAGLRALLRWLLRRKPKPVTIPPLTRDQQFKVCEMLEAELEKAKLSKNRVKAVSNALFRELSKGFAPDAGADSTASGTTAAAD
jgi:hypothetical protein